MSYSSVFQMKRFLSTELNTYDVYAKQLNEGYMWVRRRNPKHFSEIVRVPTVGCYVEIFKIQHPGCIPLDSLKARAMLKKICYF